MNLSSRIFFLYFSFWYIIPYCLMLLLGKHKNFSYATANIDVFSTTICIILIVCTLCMTQISKPIKCGNLRLGSKREKILQNIFFFIGIVMFCSALVSAMTYGVTYRSSGPRLSESNYLVLIFFALKPFSVIFLIYLLKREILHPARAYKLRFICLFFACSYLVFPVAAFDVLFVLFFLIYAISFRAFKSVFLNNSIVSLLFLMVMLAGIVLMGVSTKVGFEKIIWYFYEYGANFIRYLQYRISFYFASFEINLFLLINDSYHYVDGLNVIFESLAYRIKLLTGQAAIRPDFPNINVFNFSHVFANYKQGSEVGGSPGLLAAFLQIFPMILAIPIMLIYAFGLSGVLLSSFKLANFGLTTNLILVFVLHGLLNSPVHVSTTLGPELIKTIFIFAMLLVKFEAESEVVDSKMKKNQFCQDPSK